MKKRSKDSYSACSFLSRCSLSSLLAQSHSHSRCLSDLSRPWPSGLSEGVLLQTQAVRIRGTAAGLRANVCRPEGLLIEEKMAAGVIRWRDTEQPRQGD